MLTDPEMNRIKNYIARPWSADSPIDTYRVSGLIWGNNLSNLRKLPARTKAFKPLARYSIINALGWFCRHSFARAPVRDSKVSIWAYTDFHNSVTLLKYEKENRVKEIPLEKYFKHKYYWYTCIRGVA